jgi:hypothetical protein
MNTIRLILFIFVAAFLSGACSSRPALSTKNPYPEASVKIILTDKTEKFGIVIKATDTELDYVDAQSQKRQTIPYSSIKKLENSPVMFDYAAKPIPLSEIKNARSSQKTFLYGAAGLVLGGAVGIGAGIALFANDQQVAANAVIPVFALAGAWFFGSKGYAADFEAGAHKVRQQRAAIEKKTQDETMQQLETEKKKLEEIKKKQD